MDPIYNKNGEPRCYLATDAEYALSDEQINAILPDALPGTTITKAGYAAMKQRDHAGTWVPI